MVKYFNTFQVQGKSKLNEFVQVKSLVAEIAQLGERQTEDLKVPGSNPESTYEL